jgi:hypothetical protein
MTTKSTFRFLQHGEEVWRGSAYDAEHAEERFFDAWDEVPGSLERYTLQRWGTVKYTSTLKGKGWVTVYENANLAPC